jgi:crossover junction endodeoxyribonuclease RusA
VQEIIKDSESLGDIPIEIKINLYPPDRRIRDIDNSIKAVFDSIKGHLFDDDSQVWKLTIERKEIIKGGMAIVSIKPYNRKC